MEKTVREWINFLKGENQLIGLQLDIGLECPIEYYIPGDKWLTEFEPWMDDFIVTKVYFKNWHHDNKDYHLLIYKKAEK